MLHLISSIQTPMYLAHCYASNNIQCALVVPPEAEKIHFPIYFLWQTYTTYHKEFQMWICRVQTWIHCAIMHCPPTHKNLIIAHSKPTHTSCGTPQRECTYSVPIYSTCQKTFPVGLFRSVVSLFLLVGSFPFYCRYVLVRSGSFIRNILFCVEVSWSTANQSRCNFLTYLCGASHSART